MPYDNTLRAGRGRNAIGATSNNFAQNGKCMVARAFRFKRQERPSRLIATNPATKNGKNLPYG
jgi:hypothetical protein